jgi:hypothetical protein
LLFGSGSLFWFFVVTAEREAGVVHQCALLAWAFEDRAAPPVARGRGSDPARDRRG